MEENLKYQPEYNLLQDAYLGYNQGKTNEATKNITDPLQKGQTAPKNEHQQAQQRKPKGPKV